MNESKTMLSVSDLKTWFHVDQGFIRSVDGVSIQAGAKSRIGIAGESGSGKTQTLLSIMGLNHGEPGIVSGQIHIDGVNVLDELDKYVRIERNGILRIRKAISDWEKKHQSTMRAVRGNKISMIFQEPQSALSPCFTIGSQFEETLRARYGRVNLCEHWAYVHDLLRKIHFDHIPQLMKKYPHEFSGGQIQRLMLALALTGKPEILLADEPTTALDAFTQYQVIELFAALLDEQKFAMIFITHHLLILERLVDYVYIMFRGKIVEQGPVRQLIGKGADLNHPYTALLNDSMHFKLRGKHHFENSAIREGGTNPSEEGCAYRNRCSLFKKLNTNKQKRCGSEIPPLLKVEEDHLMACWEKTV